MASIVVSGLINLETTVQIAGFPIHYEPVRYPFFGVRSTVAGVGFNIAAALTALGDAPRLLALIGQDLTGQMTRAALRDAGIGDEGVVSSAEQTAQAAILYDPAGRRMINTDLKDLQTQMFPVDRFDAALAGCALTVLCNINWSRPLLARAKAQGVPIVTDVHAIADLDDPYNADFMRAADILFQSHERLSCAPEVWAARVRQRYGTPLIVVGLGADGALLSTPETDLRVPAVTTRPIVSSIGAGDALLSGFVSGYATGLSPVDALRRAVVFAGHKIGAAGAAEGFLSAADLDARCAAHYATGTTSRGTSA